MNIIIVIVVARHYFKPQTLRTDFFCHQEVTVCPPGTEDVDAGEAKGNLWTAVQPDCVCLGQPLRGSSQSDSPGENCPYHHRWAQMRARKYTQSAGSVEAKNAASAC